MVGTDTQSLCCQHTLTLVKSIFSVTPQTEPPHRPTSQPHDVSHLRLKLALAQEQERDREARKREQEGRLQGCLAHKKQPPLVAIQRCNPLYCKVIGAGARARAGGAEEGTGGASTGVPRT